MTTQNFTDLVSRSHPLASSNHFPSAFLNLRFRSNNLILQGTSLLVSTHQEAKIIPKTYNSKFIPRPGSLNILQRLLQILQLNINTLLRLLRLFHSLRLKGFKSFDLPANIISRRLERLEMTFDLIDDAGVVERLAVVGEIDGLRGRF